MYDFTNPLDPFGVGRTLIALSALTALAAIGATLAAISPQPSRQIGPPQTFAPMSSKRRTAR